MPEKPLILFDGVCNLCNTLVNFIIDHDPDARFQFASIQSRFAAALLAEHGRADLSAVKSMVLIENGRIYVRSAALMRVVRHLRGWRWANLLLAVIPAEMLDAAYDWIARHRYAWFGKRDACRMPSHELALRFRE